MDCLVTFDGCEVSVSGHLFISLLFIFSHNKQSSVATYLFLLFRIQLSAKSFNSVQAVSYLPVLFCTLLLAVKYMIVLGQEVIKRRQAPSQNLDLERVGIFTKMSE